MSKLGIRINYLYNSAFIIETENYIVIFDYFMDYSEDGKREKKEGTICIEDLKGEKDIIVFATHSHSDHFNPIVLEWSKNKDNIHYIFSSDINLNSQYKNVNFISPYEETNIKSIYVKAYGSTDLGVSFLVKLDGYTIFHAGDLNWWNWWDESEEYNAAIEGDFKSEIKKLKDDNETVDICFFPVDPRLKESFSLGGEYFIRNIRPEVFIPMHFGEHYTITNEFAHSMKGMQEAQSVKIVQIRNRGQEILI